MSSTTLDINSLCVWSDPKEIETRSGLRTIRTAEPTPAFWDCWRADKQAMKDAGLTVAKIGKKWEVTWWALLGAHNLPRVDIQLPEPPKPPKEPLPSVAEVEGMLLPWQPEGAARMLRAVTLFGAGLDASDLGTGKTYMTLAAYVVSGAPGMLVVCSKSGQHGWHEAAARFRVPVHVVTWDRLRLGGTPYLHRQDRKDDAGRLKERVLRWNLKRGTWIVFDEAHEAKSYKSVSCDVVIAAKQARVYPLAALSATIGETPLDFKAIGYMLGLFREPEDFWNWVRTYKCMRTDYGWKFFGDDRVMASLHQQIFTAGKGNRILKDANPHFPPQHILAEAIDMDNAPAIKRAYRKLKKELDAIEAKVEADKAVLSRDIEGQSDLHARRRLKAAKLTAMIRAMQRVEMLRVSEFAEQAKGYVEQGYHLVVTFNFIESLKKFCELTGFSLFCGETKDAERKAIIQGFAADEIAGIGMQIGTGSESINLQDFTGRHPRLSLISPTWNARHLLQFFGRTHRAKAKTVVTHKLLYAAGTIEEEQCDRVRAKAHNIRTLNDGDLTAGLPLF